MARPAIAETSGSRESLFTILTSKTCYIDRSFLAISPNLTILLLPVTAPYNVKSDQTVYPLTIPMNRMSFAWLVLALLHFNAIPPAFANGSASVGQLHANVTPYHVNTSAPILSNITTAVCSVYHQYSCSTD